MIDDVALIEKIRQFCSNREEYENPRFKEASVRAQFIDTLFRALGWDVYNDRGLPEQYKEVELEPSQEVSGQKRNPDYAFRVEGIPRFFVEAKKPSIRIDQHVDSALQIRRYSWSAGLPLGILTDFAEIAVYDCRVPPTLGDRTDTQRVLYIRIEELQARWSELYDLFSRDAVNTGSLARYTTDTAVERAGMSVDRFFLADIERWRSELALDIYARNSQLSSRDLSYVVQATLDRIIFLKICEDRGIQSDESLLAVAGQDGIYSRLFDLFRRADERYNSGLFHFDVEKGRIQAPDVLSIKIDVGDQVLSTIIGGLYPPSSPYAFSTISADILGQVYEQFLGREIVTAEGAVRVDEKPEIKKSGGVVYTPSWVVDRMVEDSLQTLVSDRTLQDILGTSGRVSLPITVLDPACGSGSFLIKVYDYLLKWFLDRYRESPQRWSRGKHARMFATSDGDWRLTSAERKRVLVDHIFGVDIDLQAVEVTKLSLLLKVLEGETKESLAQQFALFYERALPDLDNNIRCGNSLVSSDVFQTAQLTLLGDAEEEHINAFDWTREFPRVMSNGGFDLVIGNPPYLSYSGRQAIQLNPAVRTYFGRRYKTSGWPTSHTLFMERSIRQLSAQLLCFIVPDQVGHLEGYRQAREIITENAGIASVRYMGERVFPGRVTPAMIFLADKACRGGKTDLFDEGSLKPKSVQLADGDEWVASIPGPLHEKIRSDAVSLAKRVADPGVHTGNCSKKIILPESAATTGSVPVLEGKNISRYRAERPSKVLRLDYSRMEGEYFSIRPREKYTDARFVIRQTAAEPIIGPRLHADYFRNTLLALYDSPDGLDTYYLVGLLNSKLLRWVYRSTVREASQKAFPQVKVRALRELPIRAIDFTKRSDQLLYEQIIAAVSRILELCEQEEVAKSPNDARHLSARIVAVDRHIDELVYTLYGLSEDEIGAVEADYLVLTAP